MKVKILVINPGSTSTKIALYQSRELLFDKNITHTAEQLSVFDSVIEQFDFRKELVMSAVKSWGIPLSDIKVVVGRGGLVKPIKSGVYEVNDALQHDLTCGINGSHASNLGGLIAKYIAELIGTGVSAYIADPVVVDEMTDIAHISGHPLLQRKSIFHALNQKAVARSYAEKIDKHYNELNLIVAHMGGGVSVGAHNKGVVVDVNNALSGDGAFSPERCGSVAAADLIDLAYCGKYSYKELKQMIIGSGGFVAHLQTSNVKEVVDRALGGEPKAKLIVDAFAYGVAKEIGAMAAVLCGNVDAIILTGGIAYSKYICSEIEKYVKYITTVEVYPGEDEMYALATNGLMAYKGETEIKVYC
ncbi:MAG: butyrate kinase [Rikenellaceae bacterium]